MTIEQMEKTEKEENQIDKKKERRKARESRKHFRHENIELFKLGNTKEQQKPIHSNLPKEKRFISQNFDKPYTRSSVKCPSNPNNQNIKSLEQICKTLQNKVTNSVKDDGNLTFQTNEESEKGQLRIFLKQSKDFNEYEIVHNKANDNMEESIKLDPLPQPCVGRHNLPIRITQRRKSVAEPLARYNNKNAKISEVTIKPDSLNETVHPCINSLVFDNHKTENTSINDLKQQNTSTLLPLSGLLPTRTTVDEPCNMSLTNKISVPNSTNFLIDNQTAAEAAALPEPKVGKGPKCSPKNQTRKRTRAWTRMQKQNETKKEENNAASNTETQPVPNQNTNFVPGQNITQLNNASCLPQWMNNGINCKTNLAYQDNVSNNKSFEACYRQLQASQAKEAPRQQFRPTNPFIPPLPNFYYSPYVHAKNIPASEDYRRRRTFEEQFYQNPYLGNMYTLPRPPVPPQIEQERMLLNSLDMLNKYQSMEINNMASSGLINSLLVNNNNNNNRQTFMPNYLITSPPINQFSTLQRTSNNSNFHHQEPQFLFNTNAKKTTSVSDSFVTPTNSANHFRNTTTVGISPTDPFYSKNFSKPPPYSEKPINPPPPPYSEVEKSNVTSNDQTQQPPTFTCGFLTPPNSSLDVLEISEKNENPLKRCVVSSKPPMESTVPCSTSTVTDVEGPNINLSNPNENIPSSVSKCNGNGPQQHPNSLSNLLRDTVIKVNFNKLNSNRATNSSVGVTNQNSNVPNVHFSKTEENNKLKETSTQTDFSVDSVAPSTCKVQDEEGINSVKRKFSEDTKDEILNKLTALSSHPMLTRRDENKFSLNRCYESVTPVNLPVENEKDKTTISPKTGKCGENVVVVLEDSSNDEVMTNDGVILIEDSDEEAEKETEKETEKEALEHCPSKIQKSEIKEDNTKVESSSKLETLSSLNCPSTLPPLNCNDTLEPDEYVSEVKALEENKTPPEFYDFYIFVTKKQILNNQKPISFKIFLEFQNAGSLKAMEEAYKIYMSKTEKGTTP